MELTKKGERLRARFDSYVAENLLATNDMGYYYPLNVPKRKCRELIRALWLISAMVRDFEQDSGGHVVTVLDRFNSPMWKL